MKHAVRIQTPSRLHFGLLARDPGRQRQHGGVGLMIGRPALVLEARRASRFTARGPHAERARRFAEEAAAALDHGPEGVEIEVLAAPRSHVGLGSGTQLGLAVAEAVARLAGTDEPLTLRERVRLAGRGARSAIGAHGFARGGFIVEGGKGEPNELSPLLLHAAFPAAWRLVLVSPQDRAGVAGAQEREAFARLPPVPQAQTAEMCRLILLGLAPAITEADLGRFGEALYALQRIVGGCFAREQGGIYASDQLEAIVNFIRASGVAGVGQSSWGPTLYAVVEGQAAAEGLAESIRHRFELGAREVWVSEADNRGARIEDCNK